MVSHTGDGVERSEVARATRKEHIGQAALVLAAVAMVVAMIPATREYAWMPAIPAVILALSSFGTLEGRKRYGTAALLLSWFTFSYSFAMMLWG